MKIKASEINIGQIILGGRKFQCYRILNKIKETPSTITFHVNHFLYDIRCRGEGGFVKKEITYRKSTVVESREYNVGTKYNQLHRIKPDRLKNCIKRGFELYTIKAFDFENFEEFDIGDYMFAKFNGINYETESILDDGMVNAIPPSINSDKPQISHWNNTNGGFEDYYKKEDISILINMIKV